jgi:hypothetical protein
MKNETPKNGQGDSALDFIRQAFAELVDARLEMRKQVQRVDVATQQLSIALGALGVIKNGYLEAMREKNK